MVIALAKRFVSGRTVLKATLGIVACVVVGGQAMAVPPSDGQPRRERSSAFESYHLQDLDEPLKEFKPKKPRTEEEQAHLDAMAWYMTGRLKELRNDRRGAMAAYLEAVKLDPENVEIYHALVPLAFSLEETEDAVRYALKALELEPENFQLQYQIGLQLLGQQQVEQAIKFLDQARQSPRLDKNSAFYVELNRNLAIIYRHVRQFDKAAECFKVVFDARQSPARYGLDFRSRSRLANDANTSYETIGQVFLDANRIDDALQAFELAAEEQKGRPGRQRHVNYNLALVYQKTEQFDKALEQLQLYFDAQLQSKGRDAYELLATLLEQTGKKDELIPRLEEIAEKDPRNSTLQYFLAAKYVEQNRLDEAEAIYRRVLKDMSDAEGYVGLASVLRRQKQADELLDVLTEALKADRNTSDLEQELNLLSKDEELVNKLIAVGRSRAEGDEPQLDFAGSFLLAKLAAQTRNTDATVQFYNYALKTKPGRAAGIYEELASYLMVAEEYDKAADVLQEAIDEPTLRNHRPEFYYRFSQLHQLKGDLPAALATIAEALKIAPESPQLRFQEAHLHYLDRQWDKAADLFQKLIDKHKNDPDPRQRGIIRFARFSLSNILVQQGHNAEGEKILEEILAADPDDPRVNNDLGYLWADQNKNLEQAEKMIRKAVDAEPENPAYLDSLGWVLYRLGKHAEAVDHLKKAVTLPFGSDSTIWEHLGDCYIELDNRNEAVESWKKALEEEQKGSKPSDEVIKRLQEKMKDDNKN